MTFRLVERPGDRPEWLTQLIDLITRDLEASRARLLERVGRAGDDELVAGSDDDWGVGQIALHLLLTERGMLGIAQRLARGEQPRTTAQPRPDVGTTTRAALHDAAAKAAQAVERLRAEFPADPDVETAAVGPYFGPFNCVSWLIMATLHYRAHLDALERGTKSAL